MSERFFVATRIDDERATLEGAEAHHLTQVMRAKAGDEVLLFDGSGQEFVARIGRIDKHRIEMIVLERRAADREAAVPITAAVALPKGDRQRWLVEKLVELGVSRLVPLETRRGVAVATPAAIARLRRSVIEASKQCGRNRLLEISEPKSWMEFVANESAELRVVAYLGGAPIHAVWPSDPASVAFAVGPEGGFADDEVTAAQSHGWKIVDLGPRILRVETAAVALAAWASLNAIQARVD